MKPEIDLLAGLATELRRGTTVMCVLSQLKEERYGYELSKDLGSQGVSAETNTLYPLLRRLEQQGILESLWDTKDTKPRKYYRCTELGDVVYEGLKKEWQKLNAVISTLLEVDDQY